MTVDGGILRAMRRHWVGLFVAFAAMAAAQAGPSTQLPVWQMQDSGTTAGLRGIDSVDGTAAWASGTGGEVLRTVDGGKHWTKCAVPDGDKDGGTLDFRGVQAWDAKTAIVMASGPGEKSRLYKTGDGCGTWKLVFKNPDKDGFWDALKFFDRDLGVLVGDPVDGKIFARLTSDAGMSWRRFFDEDTLKVGTLQAGIFAASNSSLVLRSENPNIVELVANVNGTAESYLAAFGENCDLPSSGKRSSCSLGWSWELPDDLPIPSDGKSRGVFSLAWDINKGWGIRVEVAVGGDYRHPENKTGTAAYTVDSGETWHPSARPPHGYRSTVQWSESLKVWITAGTNGSDISRDDGRTWQPLDDGNWNALSLPFIVGPNGRIGRLNAGALAKP